MLASVRRKRTGLMTWAAAQGAPNSVELLAAAGFDVNALGRSDILSNMPWHTALHAAAETGNLTLARTLLDLGADPPIRDKHQRSTPLDWARHFDQTAFGRTTRTAHRTNLTAPGGGSGAHFGQ